MKNSGRRGKFFVAFLIAPVFAIFLSTVIYADQGIIISLENTGPSPISNAFLGFDLQPINPGQLLPDVTVGGAVGGGSEAPNIGDFQIGVIPISEENPLPPGGTACVGPLSLASGDYIKYVAVSSFQTGYGENFPNGGLELVPDVTTLAFDPNDASFYGWGVVGIIRFSSSVPDGCKTDYAPPFGRIEINSGALLTTSASADLSLNCYPTVGYTCEEMQLSNDNINWSAPEPYTRNITWALLQGDGEKTVYVKFKDSAGNWSDVYGDKIIIGTLTPNGGEIIPSGSTYIIQWIAPSNAVRFDLKYSMNNGSTWKTIADKVPGTSCGWRVPTPSNNKTRCLVKVIGFDSSGRKVGEDVSDSAFTIEVINATSPDGGEILKSGDTQTITWRTNGTIKPVASVRLFYSINGGASWKPIRTVMNNLGTYHWTVPHVSSSNCKIKVVLTDAGGVIVGSDISDGFFTIQP